VPTLSHLASYTPTTPLLFNSLATFVSGLALYIAYATSHAHFPLCRYEGESINRSQMGTKLKKKVIFEPGKNFYFSTYPPPTMIHLSHRFTCASKSAACKSFHCCLSHFRTSVSTFWSPAKRLKPRRFSSGPHRWKSLGAKCKAHVQDVPTIVLEFSLGLLGLYGVWHCHDEAVPLLTVGLDVFCELHSEASTELHSTMQNSHFHHASENWLTVLPENPKTR
jgi:hypothetical protein